MPNSDQNSSVRSVADAACRALRNHTSLEHEIGQGDGALPKEAFDGVTLNIDISGHEFGAPGVIPPRPAFIEHPHVPGPDLTHLFDREPSPRSTVIVIGGDGKLTATEVAGNQFAERCPYCDGTGLVGVASMFRETVAVPCPVCRCGADVLPMAHCPPGPLAAETLAAFEELDEAATASFDLARKLNADTEGSPARFAVPTALAPADSGETPPAETAGTIETFVQIIHPSTGIWSKVSRKTGRIVATSPDRFPDVQIHRREFAQGDAPIVGERVVMDDGSVKVDRPLADEAMLTEDDRALYAHLKPRSKTAGEIFMSLAPRHNTVIAAWAGDPGVQLAVGGQQSKWRTFCQARAEFIKVGTPVFRDKVITAYRDWVVEFVTEPTAGLTLDQTVNGLVFACNERLRRAIKA